MRGVESTLDREALKAAVAADGSAPAADALVGQLFDGFYDRLGPDFGPTDCGAQRGRRP
jgi:lysophospholipase